MRRFIPAILIFTALVAASAYSVRGGQNPLNERAIVDLTDNTVVAGVVLHGKYIFYHDYDRKARSEPCMLVYTVKDGHEGELVVEFHCMAVERPKVRTTVVSVGLTAEAGVFKLTEIQFPDSTVGHRVMGE